MQDETIEALEHIRFYFSECRDNSQNARAKEMFAWYVKAVEDAVKRLKEQEPIEPIRTDEEWLCGNCNKSVGWDELQVYGIAPIQFAYCSYCGRKVKWDANEHKADE